MKILVVVDMQNDFVSGSLGTAEAQAIVPAVKAKIAEYQANGDIIIYTRDTHFSNYLATPEGNKLPVEHCIRDTWGWEIVDGVYIDGCNVLNKVTFGSTDLVDYIEDYIAMNEQTNPITEIELIGLCTDICVVSNALSVKMYFYDCCEISVDSACCAGVTPESHEAALLTMKMCQINIK